MKLNKAGIDLIKKFEGCKLTAYPDPATGGDPWTIGWGSTKGVKKGDVWTQKQADDALATECEEWCKGILKLVKAQLNDNQFSALVSFVHNVGLGNFGKSTMLKLINQNKLKEASEEFVKWNKAAGKVMAGLTKRRQAEKDLFIS